MNWKRYEVRYFDKTNPHRLDRDFSRYRFEALNSQDAIKLAKNAYTKEFERGLRNLPDIRNVKFTARRIEY